MQHKPSILVRLQDQHAYEKSSFAQYSDLSQKEVNDNIAVSVYSCRGNVAIIWIYNGQEMYTENPLIKNLNYT